MALKQAVHSLTTTFPCRQQQPSDFHARVTNSENPVSTTYDSLNLAPGYVFPDTTSLETSAEDIDSRPPITCVAKTPNYNSPTVSSLCIDHTIGPDLHEASEIEMEKEAWWDDILLDINASFEFFDTDLGNLE